MKFISLTFSGKLQFSSPEGSTVVSGFQTNSLCQLQPGIVAYLTRWIAKIGDSQKWIAYLLSLSKNSLQALAKATLICL